VETALAYDDLRDWIKALDKAGELKHIHEPVDPILEIAEITDRVSKWGRLGGPRCGGRGISPGRTGAAV
jgi:4-hydroxy-3-polyprenylbenzoate decarboxylase